MTGEDTTMQEKLTQLLQWLHEHPEVGLRETDTTRKFRQVLEAHGITVLESGLETGLVAQSPAGQSACGRISMRCPFRRTKATRGYRSIPAACTPADMISMPHRCWGLR